MAPVPRKLAGIETQPEATLAAAAGGQTLNFKWLDDSVGVSQSRQTDTRFEVQAVFAGHGIAAPGIQIRRFQGPRCQWPTAARLYQ